MSSQLQSETNDSMRESSQDERSWFSGLLGTALRMILFQIAISYFIGRKKDRVAVETSGGEVLPVLHNFFSPGDRFDMYAHIVFGEDISSMELEKLSKDLITMGITSNSSKLLNYNVWKLENLEYTSMSSSLAKNVTIIPPLELFDEKLNISANLIMTLFPHKNKELIPMNHISLVKWMPKLSQEDSLVNLLDNPSKTTLDIKSTSGKTDNMIKYWKNSIDLRVIFDQQTYSTKQAHIPPLSYMQYSINLGVYLPIVYPSDFWCIEKNFVALNSTLIGKPLNLTLTFDTFTLFKYSIQRQMVDSWEFQNHYGLGQNQRDIFMIKRIFLETNRYYLMFSFVFFVLHSSFQVLAFKNDISFWHNNESMHGLSGLSIFASFISELIIGLYLLDSNETSWILLVEIFIGISISAWKMWKAKIFVLSKKFPYINFKQVFNDTSETDKHLKNSETLTRHYDYVAIKYMSIMLIPCTFGYAIYCLNHYKYRSWYSFFISVLAGTVYTFGFIMMTPQLYINYKLKSVDHLPWRYLIYKALNTFIDDIFSFIIDMPWMHRLACFRDDVIFIIYIYQRWIYSEDKSRGHLSGDNELVKTANTVEERDENMKEIEDITSNKETNLNYEGIRLRNSIKNQN
ncbi:clptm1 family protein [Cryptosporidium muris RN66]|uniref:Clptm1 family protein n=1 Tax=Cryptosporidium muris (strain RN66) TaxID=441375 RepID=B6ABX2_CRYMR|nr:clptm1 family protein [Cryptosporidium muris RN66]EEA05325.1 clptm1 family protein [Cryptosporidium muris RN66]|eukprot:XP_002139674.1 clptm1 family protein [Cryptosporidium muris RN66]